MTRYNPFPPALLDTLRSLNFTDTVLDDLISISDFPELAYAVRREDPSTYIIDIDAPGYDREDITLSIDGRDLVVHAKEVKTPNAEFNRPSARVTFSMDEEVEVVSATFSRSVLSVSFRRLLKDGAVPKQIPIN